MAARVNTKFVLIIFIAFATLLSGIGGVWIVKKKNDSTRHIRRGDEFMQQGDFKTAKRFYERAVGKEPANLAFLAKLEDALTRIQPQTADESSELYRAYVSLLKHRATHHPSNAEMHLRLLEELRQAARRTKAWTYAELLADSAENMEMRLAVGVPERKLARYYHGEANFSPWMHDRLTEQEIEEAEAELVAFLADVPNDDSGWATLVRGRLAIAERLLEAGQATRAEAKLEQVRQSIATARTQVTDGPEVLVAALYLARFDGRQDRASMDDAAVRADAERLVQLLKERDDPWIVGETIQILDRLRLVEGMPDPVLVAAEYLERHPDAHEQRFFKATLLYYFNEPDEAEANARQILESDPLTVGFASQRQFELKRRAASLLVDVAVQRWEKAPSEEKKEVAAGALAALETLEKAVKDPENDPFVMRARGKIAYARGNYDLAAALFNQVANDGLGIDFETLMYLGIALEQKGEFGAALQRINEALELRPGHTTVILHLAGLMVRMARYEEASDLLDLVLAAAPDNEIAIRMRGDLTARLAEETGEVSDPVRIALREAQNAAEDQDLETARSALLAAFQGRENDLRLLNGLIRVEMLAGRTDEAMAYLDRALEIAPTAPAFIELKSWLSSDDPIEIMRTYITTTEPDEPGQSIEMLIGMRQLVLKHVALSAKLEAAGETEKLAVSEDIRIRAQREEASFRAKVEQIAPEHPRFIEYRFLVSLRAKDWEETERVVALAGRLDSDQAGGAMFRGRYSIAREDAEQAVRDFTEATERIPHSSMAWRLLGMCYRLVGNQPEAMRAFDRSYSNNPNDVTTVRGYTDLLTRTGNKSRALTILRDARRLAPNDIPLRERWLELELEIGDQAQALRTRREIFAEDPSDMVNAAALAKFLGRRVPSRELLLDKDGNERYPADKWARLPEAGSQMPNRTGLLREERTEWYQEADRIVEAMVAPEDRDLAWSVLRAGLLRTRGEVSEGEALLVAETEKEEERFTALLALGIYQAQCKRDDEAFVTLHRAIELQDEETRTGELTLGEMLFRLERHEEAIGYFESVLAVAPTPKLRRQLAESSLKLKRFDEARAHLDALDEKIVPDMESVLLRAALIGGEADALWAAGQEAEAEARFEEQRELIDRAELLNPTDPLPEVMHATRLYSAWQRTRDTALLDDALRALSRADEIQAEFPRTSLVRVAVLQAQDNQRGALNELRGLVARAPGFDQARRALIRLMLQEGRYETACEAAREAIEVNPASAEWNEVLGDLYQWRLRRAIPEREERGAGTRAGRELTREINDLRKEMKEQFEVTMSIAPAPRLVVKLAEAIMTLEPPDYAGAVALVKKYPELLEESTLVQMMYARALEGAGRHEDAVAQMSMAYRTIRGLIDSGQVNRSNISTWYGGLQFLFAKLEETAELEAYAREQAGANLDAYELLSLASYWKLRSRDGVSRSIELLREASEAAAAAGDDPRLRTKIYADLGLALINDGQYREAVEAIKSAVELNPRYADGLNNIAYVLSEKLKEPREALPYAQDAVRLSPAGSWSVLDTLGLVHFRLDQYDEAERFLRQSEEIEATAANQLHLAMVAVEKSDFKKARRLLLRASELRPDPDTQTEIDRVWDDIRTLDPDGE